MRLGCFVAWRNTYLRNTTQVARLACILLLMSGCQWLAPNTATRNAAGRDSLSAREMPGRHNARTRDRIAALELDLAKKDAELARALEANRALVEELRVARSDIEQVEKQFVSFERRLTREETKASAVAAIAEAQLRFDELNANENTRPDVETKTEYDAKMAAAEEFIKKPNYSAAVYYAQRAMRILNRMERIRQTSLSDGKTRIIAVSKANIRKGPGSDFSVLEQLAYGSALVELGNKDNWAKVRSRSGKTGWIHRDLIR